MTEAFPLQWPEGWPRARGRDSDRKFDGRIHKLTLARARDGLLSELKQLGARDIIISSNVALRLDGLPYSQQGKLYDPGVAVYFKLKKRPLVMATDRFESPSGNMRSLTLAVSAMRQLERHGGGTMMERAFTGFVAIAPPDWKKPWREVFGVKPEWHGDIAQLYREKARHRHPDAGGSDTLMAELNVAFEEAKNEMGDASK